MINDRTSLRKAFFIGLILTAVGVFLKLYAGWNEGTILCLVVGPVMLLCSLVIALSYRWMARIDISHLPEDWENLSSEAKGDFVRKQLMEKNSKGRITTHQLIRLNKAQRHNAEDSTKQ
jgi:hypothetical protein